MARIIIVDDDEHFRKVYSQILNQNGHEIAEAFDGSDGVEVLIAKPVDIAVIDIMMPIRDGFDIISDIKKLFPNIKIIAVSGSATDEELIRAKNMGADITLAKPFESRFLIEAINKVLSD